MVGVDVADGDEADELAGTVAHGEVSDTAVAEYAGGFVEFGIGAAEDDLAGHDIGDEYRAWCAFFGDDTTEDITFGEDANDSLLGGDDEGADLLLVHDTGCVEHGCGGVDFVNGRTLDSEDIVNGRHE